MAIAWAASAAAGVAPTSASMPHTASRILAAARTVGRSCIGANTVRRRLAAFLRASVAFSRHATEPWGLITRITDEWQVALSARRGGLFRGSSAADPPHRGVTLLP